MQLHKRLEQSVFLVQKPLKAGVRVDLPTNRAQFFLRAIDFLCFLRQKRAKERRGQLPEPEMKSEGL